MQYEKIFWLEDNPTFLKDIIEMSQELENKLEMIGLLSRITFAHDCRSAIKRINNNFDLYIFDVDFPDNLRPERKEEIDDFFGKLRNGKEAELRYDGLYIEGGVVANNLKVFYASVSSELHKKKILVFTASLLASVFTRDHKLPYYSKNYDINSVYRLLKNVNNGDPDIKGHEYGTSRELVERYLIK